ncbi:hypothetical protein ACFX14_027633 [Malus domestica]
MEVWFWEDNWVLGILGGHPTLLNHSAIIRECKVTEFVNPVSRDWNFDLLSNVISETKRDAISRIYVGRL